MATIIFGYGFLIDISNKINWDEYKVLQRHLNYFSIKTDWHTLRIEELIEVVTANHPANAMPDRPFDRFELVSSSDRITILPSFHRREELERLLQHLYGQRPEAFADPKVIEFMNGEFSNWWRYRG